MTVHVTCIVKLIRSCAVDVPNARTDWSEPSLVVCLQGCVGKDTKNRRRLFLFNDVLLLAKPRASNTYSLRQRFWLPETWLTKAESDDDGYSFYVGSPFCRRCRVSFPSPTLRSKWFATLQDTIAAARLATGNLRPGDGTALVHPVGCAGDGVLEPPGGADVSADSPAPAVIKRGIAGVCLVGVGVGASTTAHDIITQTVAALAGHKDRVPEHFRGPTRLLQLHELGTVGVAPVAANALPLALLRAGGRCGLHASKCQFLLTAQADGPVQLDTLPVGVSKLCVLAHDTAAGGKRTSRAMSAHTNSPVASSPQRTVSTGGVGRSVTPAGGAGDDRKKGGMFTKLSVGLSKRLHTVQANISKRLSGSGAGADEVRASRASTRRHP
eukprot:m.964712 g.964712  ORF g.964712 m.964712 type:complete len:383 (-) comp23905_c0_seq1:2788-3936(-)